MKILLFSLCALFSVTSVSAFAGEQPSAEALLHKMSQASRQLNYELSYILIRKNSIEPLLYRHSVNDGEQYAHLVYLSGPYREVIRRGDEVSYQETGSDPFSIKSQQMVAPLIPMLTSNIDYLKKYYDFLHIGRAREAGAATEILRIVPKDGLRYSYVLWVDDKYKLPLRADLVDRDGEVLEQYRTISYSVTPQIAQVMKGLKHAKLPEVITLPKAQATTSHWQVTWKPRGFKSQEINRYRMAVTDQMVESQLFSDGLFHFSVYVAKRDEHSLKGQLVRQGRRTLNSYVSGDYEISVVGDIPPATAQKIAQSITFDKVESGDSK